MIALGPPRKALRVVKVQFGEDPAADPILVVEAV
jgi:hypothetical protein